MIIGGSQSSKNLFWLPCQLRILLLITEGKNTISKLPRIDGLVVAFYFFNKLWKANLSTSKLDKIQKMYYKLSQLSTISSQFAILGGFCGVAVWGIYDPPETALVYYWRQRCSDISHGYTSNCINIVHLYATCILCIIRNTICICIIV